MTKLKLAAVSPASLCILSDRIAAFGLYLFAFSVWLGSAMSNAGLGLMLLMFLLSPPAWKWALSSRVVWACAATIVYILIRTQLAAIEWPATAEMQWDRAQEWIVLLLFVVVAWPLWKRPQRVWIAAGLAALGLVVGTLLSLDTETVRAVQAGTLRFSGYIGKPIAYAFYVSVVLLGLMVWCANYFAAAGKASPAARWALAITLWASVILLLWGFLASNSRGPLLAAITVLPLAAVWRFRRAGAERPKRPLLVAALLLAVALMVAAGAGPMIERFKEVQETAANLDEGLDGAELNNITLRLHMWTYSMQQWTQRPLLGWGPGSVEPVLEASDQAALNYFGAPWDHLHSAYVQTLFTLGLVGALLILLVIALLIRPLWKRYRAGEVGREDAIFFISGFGLIAVYSLTDFRHLNQDWQMFWLLFSGMTLARGRAS